MNKLYQLLIILLLPTIGMAQDVEMADALRSSGKIYVVVAVIVIVFLGLFAYLITIDRKVREIEKELDKK